MPLLSGKAKKILSKPEAAAPEHPLALAVAYNTHRQHGKRPSSAPAMAPAEELDERPASIAEAIMRKRKPAEPALEDDLAEFDDLDLQDFGKEDYSDTELTHAAAPAPGGSIAAKIRAKLRA